MQVLKAFGTRRHRVVLAGLVALATAVAGPAVGAPREPAAFGAALTGELTTYEVRRGDSLSKIGSRVGVLSRVIARDNRLDRGATLKPGTVLAIDRRRIVPEMQTHGVLVNVGQRLLFDFDSGVLRAAYPIAVGKPDWQTPLGAFVIDNLQKDKPWIVPKSIQEEMRLEGKPVLARVEPGPDNPLGRYWIGLSMPAIGIHGTNAPTSINGYRTHGCMRMHPDDIEALFPRLGVGRPGAIVYRTALLAGLPDGRIFVEIHRDAYRRAQDPIVALQALAVERGLSERIDWGKVQLLARERDGVAREVGLTFPKPGPSAPPAPSIAVQAGQ